MELSRNRSAAFEQRITDLQDEVAHAKAQLEELTTRLEDQQRQQQETTPEAEIRQEMQSLRMRIREQQVRAEARLKAGDLDLFNLRDMHVLRMNTVNDAGIGIFERSFSREG